MFRFPPNKSFPARFSAHSLDDEMGRPPSLTTPDRGRRSTRVVDNGSPDSNGSSSVAYPRRFPRLGNSYQHKFSTEEDASLIVRPPPVPMSDDIPHRTVSEVDNDTVEATEVENQAAEDPRPSKPVEAGYGVSKSDASETPQKLVQDASYAHYVQGLMDDSPVTDAEGSGLDIVGWTHAVVQWHDVQQRAGHKSRKSRFKRPSSNALPTFGTKKPKLDDNNQGEEHVRLYRGRHDTSEQACWSTLVHLGRGQALSIQRARLRQQYNDRFKQPLRESSESWRKEYARSADVRGDFRKRPAPDTDTTPPADSVLSDPEYSKSVWKAVLACASTIENMAQSKEEGDSVSLPTVLAFIGRACHLPQPEELFRGSEASHMVEEISKTMWSLLNIVQASKNAHAKLLDSWHKHGIDVEAMRKIVLAAKESSPLSLTEIPELERQVKVVAEWQSRLDEILGDSEGQEDRDDMPALLALSAESDRHGFVCKGKLQLETKLEKARSLMERINRWKLECENEKQPIKTLSALVRDIQRTKFLFPEATEVLSLNSEFDAWTDRANIAIRSKISLDEIEQLIAKGDRMPLDVSDHVEKLRSRLGLAAEWIESCDSVVPSVFSDDRIDRLGWMRAVREKLNNGMYSDIQELATEGSRVPVEIEKVRLLQIELDARNWTAKTCSWLPAGLSDGNQTKRGKIEDLQDHLEKATALRERLGLSTEEVKNWPLEGEAELTALVDSAEQWYERYEEFLDGDNRRNGNRKCLSLAKLRQVCKEGDAIHANLGSVTVKISKILGQAEEWFEKHEALLVNCRQDPLTMDPSSYIDVDELKSAVDEAGSDIALDIDEAVEISKLLEKIDTWRDRATVAVSGKRRRVGKKVTFTVPSLEKFIKDADTLPFDTQEIVRQLQEQLEAVREWQKRSSFELDGIAAGFSHLREAITETYKSPKEYSRDLTPVFKPVVEASCEDGEHAHDEGPGVVSKDNSMSDADDDNKDADDNASNCGTVSTNTSEQDHTSLAHLGSGDCNVHTMIKTLVHDSRNSCIVTPEGDIVAKLEVVWRWCMRSLKHLENTKDIFDKRFFGAFDRILKEGRDLLKSGNYNSTEEGANGKLASSWGDLVKDQLVRLDVLLAERDKFMRWSSKAQQVISSDDRRVPLQKARELELESRVFPEGDELVNKIKEIVSVANAWVEETSQALNAEDRMSLSEAKLLLDRGLRLGVSCDELRIIRTGIKEARGWATKVRKCKVEEGAADSAVVTELHEEYGSLIIGLPDEFSKLQHALRNYCICRKPYDGFMISCDICDEWFHGPCVGISENRADKVTKYQCVRCCVQKGFRSSAANAVGIVRKWNSRGDLFKSRTTENQKHQRKVRRDQKELEKLQQRKEELQSSLGKLQECKPDHSSEPTVETTAPSTGKSADGLDEQSDSAKIQADPLAGVTSPVPTSDTSKSPVAVPSTPSQVDISVLAASDNADVSTSDLPMDEAPIVPSASGNTDISASEPPVDKPPIMPSASENSDMSTSEHPLDLAPTVPSASENAEEKPPVVSSSFLPSINAPVIPSSDTVAEVVEKAPCDDTNNNVGPLPLTASSSKGENAAELEKQLETVTRSITLCESKLEKLGAVDLKRREDQVREDKSAVDLAVWTQKLCNLVLVPMDADSAAKAAPLPDGGISSVMQDLLEEAKRSSLGSFKDVAFVENEFACLGWYMVAAAKLARRPSLTEVKSIVDKASRLKLPEEKSVRMMRAMANKATTWETRVRTALCPRPGETKPFNMKVLKDLAKAANDIPLVSSMETRLLNAIEDEGLRYCLCRGPSDGRFMLSCDQCKNWFHGTCLGIPKEVGEGLDVWKCHRCTGQYVELEPKIASFHDTFDVKEEDSTFGDEDVAPKAPKVKDMWPPFGVKGCTRAVEVLGPIVSRIAEAQGNGGETKSSSSVPLKAPSAAAASNDELETNQNALRHPSSVKEEDPPVKEPNSALAKETPDMKSQPFMMNPMLPMLLVGGPLMMTMGGAAPVCVGSASGDNGMGQPAKEVKSEGTYETSKSVDIDESNSVGRLTLECPPVESQVCSSEMECSPVQSELVKDTQDEIENSREGNPDVVSASAASLPVPGTCMGTEVDSTNQEPVGIEAEADGGIDSCPPVSISKPIEESIPEPMVLVGGDKGGDE